MAKDPSASIVALLPTGMEQLLAIMGGATPPPAMAETLGFSLAEVGPGRAVFVGRPDETVYNPLGTVHGGYAATLLDSAIGCAVHSELGPGQGYTTLELKVAFHRPLTKDSGEIRAEGKTIQVGRRAAFGEARLTDAQGRLCATATSTLLVFEQ